MQIKAALLDENGVYLRMDTLNSYAEITERHLPTIMECDLPSDRYKWVPDTTGSNPYGGRFVALEYLGLTPKDNK